MNEGLVAAAAIHEDLQSDNTSSEHLENNEENPYLPLDFAFVRSLCSEPKTLDEALQGPNAKEWQTALDYEISQLEKLGTWVVETLPQG